jgi:aconitate hydratase
MTEPLGKGKDGKPVYLGDIWPTSDEIDALMKLRDEPEGLPKPTTPRSCRQARASCGRSKGPKGQVYDWPEPRPTSPSRPSSTASRCSPGRKGPASRRARAGAVRRLITTDHISPAGSSRTSSPAGRYLLATACAKADFNSYGSRRGNHEVMMRGTFANVRIKNLMLPPAPTARAWKAGSRCTSPTARRCRSTTRP